MPFLRSVAGLAYLLALFQPSIANGQSAGRSSMPAGTFVGRDSLDARKEGATESRTRPDLHGSATWTIELDSLDLRPKFTLRFEIPEPSPVTIVLRSLDSLPPRPGQYTVMLPSTGASHSRAGTLHGDIYTRERNRDRRYIVGGSRVLIASVTMSDGQPIVTGSVEMQGSRYADAPPKTLVFDYVWFNVRGDFAARPAPNTRPRVVVTSRMQEAVLRRAIDGFAITHSGAINGDGSADSTHQAGLARRFLESRWRDAAIVEFTQATATRFQVRLRGRQTPVVCEGESTTEDVDCVTLPAPVVAIAGASPGAVAGRLSIRLPNGTVATGNANTVHLLPNPVPIKDAIRAVCDKQEKRDVIADRAFTAKIESLKDTAAQAATEKEYISLLNKHMDSDRKEFYSLLGAHSAQHAIAGSGGQYAFSGIAPGNYLLFAALLGEETVHEWYVPITMRGGERVARDLDGSNVSSPGLVCGIPLPFPAIHERDRPK